jgi:hypothetical protein
VRPIASLCAALMLTACASWPPPFGEEERPEPPPVERTPVKVVEWLKLLRWQIDLTAEVAYRDPDPGKRRAFIDLHAERVALYAILREHAHDPDAATTAGNAAHAALRTLRALRSPEAVAFCEADPKNDVCGLPK